jgi:outer membrane protein assembly factor BamB
MQNSVFICYSRKDAAFTDRLCADLRARGVAIWRDVDNIPGHVDASSEGWRMAIQQALNECDTMIIILSPDSIASKEVSAEWNYFLTRRQDVRAYPVQARECEVPYRLWALNVWDLRTDYAAKVDHLASVLTGREAPPPRRAEPARKRPLPAWVWKAALPLVAVAALGVAAIATGGFGLLKPGDSHAPPASPGDVNPEDFPLPSDSGQLPGAGASEGEPASPGAGLEEAVATTAAGADLSVIGQALWEADVVGDIRLAPTVGPDGTVYVVTEAGMLVALSPDGDELWSVVLGGVGTFVDYTSAAVAPNGRIYAVFGNELLTYDPDGTPGWTWSHSGEWLTSPPAFGPDGTAYVMSSKSSLWAISPQGVELWGQPLCQVYGGGTWPGPAVGADGTVYGVCKGEDIYALDPLTGSILWTYHTNDTMESTPASGADGIVYFASEGGWVFAMQPDGEPLWMTSVAGPAGMIKMVDAPTIVGPDGTVYVAPRHGVLYALDPVDGALRWQASVGGQGVGGYPVAAADDGSVYARNLDRELICFSPEGVELWRVRPAADEQTALSPPAAGPGGRLYVGIGQRLYAFQTGD